MTPEIPAEGIMKTGEWGDSISYRIACNCHSSDHNHDLWIEADEVDISVTVYTTVKSKWWQTNRWKSIWSLLTKGYIETEATICLTQQQALNYSEVLRQGIQDVEKFRNDRKRKKINE